MASRLASLRRAFWPQRPARYRLYSSRSRALAKSRKPPKTSRSAGKSALDTRAPSRSSRPDLVAADMICSVPATAKSRVGRVFRFVAARIGCTAIPDSWSLAAFGDCDFRAERVRGHAMVALLGPWRPGWPPRPWSFLVDGPQIARTPRRVVGEADRRSFVFPRGRVAGWSSSPPSGSRQPLSSMLGGIPRRSQAAAAGSSIVVARASAGPRRGDRATTGGSIASSGLMPAMWRPSRAIRSTAPPGSSILTVLAAGFGVSEVRTARARDAVVRWVDAFNERDLQGMLGRFHPEVRFRPLRLVGLDGSSRAHDGVRR